MCYFLKVRTHLLSSSAAFKVRCVSVCVRNIDLRTFGPASSATEILKPGSKVEVNFEGVRV